MHNLFITVDTVNITATPSNIVNTIIIITTVIITTIIITTIIITITITIITIIRGFAGGAGGDSAQEQTHLAEI